MNLFAFSNGVYDFEKMEIREGRADDMIRTSCGYEFVNEYSNKQKVIDALVNIFPDQKMMEFFIGYIAASISGLNDSNLLLVLKCIDLRYCGVLKYLILNTLGGYCYNVSDLSEIIVGRKKINLSHLKTIRMLVSESIDCLTQKETYTLVDFKRVKHYNKKKVEEFDIKFSTLCLCNEDPFIADEVMENTALITIKNNKFVNRKININDFFLLLVEYLEKFKNGEILIDKNFIGDYKEKKSENDNNKKIIAFLEDCIVVDGVSNVKTSDLYDKYKNWAKKDPNPFSRITLYKMIRSRGIKFKRCVRIDKKNAPVSLFLGIRLC
jgi:hypothetical protein